MAAISSLGCVFNPASDVGGSRNLEKDFQILQRPQISLREFNNYRLILEAFVRDDAKMDPDLVVKTLLTAAKCVQKLYIEEKQNRFDQKCLPRDYAEAFWSIAEGFKQIQD